MRGKKLQPYKSTLEKNYTRTPHIHRNSVQNNVPSTSHVFPDDGRARPKHVANVYVKVQYNLAGIQCALDGTDLMIYREKGLDGRNASGGYEDISKLKLTDTGDSWALSRLSFRRLFTVRHCKERN